MALGTRIIVMSSRPGKIVKQFYADFTYRISNVNHENTRYTSEYMEIRDEILDIINCQNEELKFT
ncbi:hypothetical protein SDC9_209947 [bioreactor metagenome]|uniref:Uncharacterized protein n=1 Tax=bioreactor metagenome TaxID=1076179 RepID=A0A645JGG5_9ZZZZ